MAQNGSDTLVLANIGTAELPSYMVVGCQRDANWSEASATIDTSCKDLRAQRVLPGRYSGSLSLDALYIPDDEAYQALKAANRAGELILLARQEAGVVIETVLAKVDNLDEAFPDQDGAMISAAFTFDGFPIAVGS